MKCYTNHIFTSEDVEKVIYDIFLIDTDTKNKYPAYRNHLCSVWNINCVWYKKYMCFTGVTIHQLEEINRPDMADRNSSESRLPVRLKMRLQAVLLCGILGLPSIIVTITLFIITQVSAVTGEIMIHQLHMLFVIFTHDGRIDWQYNHFTNISDKHTTRKYFHCNGSGNQYSPSYQQPYGLFWVVR